MKLFLDNKEITSNALNKCYKQAKSEAIKEFAERLKENISDYCHIVSDEGEYVGYDCDDVIYCIDNLVKEMELMNL